ncbi:MAG TPA: hypothetical protein VJJ22_00350 [Candidatus Paceibacterota bacterium]
MDSAGYWHLVRRSQHDLSLGGLQKITSVGKWELAWTIAYFGSLGAARRINYLRGYEEGQNYFLPTLKEGQVAEVAGDKMWWRFPSRGPNEEDQWQECLPVIICADEDGDTKRTPTFLVFADYVWPDRGAVWWDRDTSHKSWPLAVAETEVSSARVDVVEVQRALSSTVVTTRKE